MRPPGRHANRCGRRTAELAPMPLREACSPPRVQTSKSAAERAQRPKIYPSRPAQVLADPNKRDKMVRRTVALLALAASATAFTTSRSALPAPARAPVAAAAPEMKFRVCDLTGKRRNAKAMTVTFSHTRNHKVQQVNLQDRRLWWPEGDKYVKMRLSTRALKTIAKYGLNTAAKKYDVDLEQFAR